MSEAGASPVEYHEYQWAYSIMDSSRVSTFLISMLLIVYGSFRSLNMEQEARERQEKERQQNASSLTGLLSGAQVQQTQPDNNVQTLDTMQALCLPLGASVSLLVMFFFFDSMQMLFAICTASKRPLPNRCLVNQTVLSCLRVFIGNYLLMLTIVAS